MGTVVGKCMQHHGGSCHEICAVFKGGSMCVAHFGPQNAFEAESFPQKRVSVWTVGTSHWKGVVIGGPSGDLYSVFEPNLHE